MILGRKGLVVGSLSLALLTLAGCGTNDNQEQAQNDSNDDVQYIEGADEEAKDHEHEGEDHDHEHEDSDEPEIVRAINDDGYVTLHGDHSHEYSGKVPFDADIDDALVMKDDNYELNDNDVQYKNKDGYIIKVDGKYYLYKADVEEDD